MENVPRKGELSGPGAAVILDDAKVCPDAGEKAFCGQVFGNPLGATLEIEFRRVEIDVTGNS